MSLAAAARTAVREHPFLVDALRADVVNYTAAADFLELDGEREAVATALRRFAADLGAYETSDRGARVTMQSGVGVLDGETADDPNGDADADADERADAVAADPLVSVGGATVVPDAGSETAVLATGDVDAAALHSVLGALTVAEIPVQAAAVAGGVLLVVVSRREGAAAVQAVERGLAGVPTVPA